MTASKRTAVDRLYTRAKNHATRQLGGATGFNVVGPTIRRMAVGDAILTILVHQDDTIAPDTVVALLGDLYDKLTDDPDFH